MKKINLTRDLKGYRNLKTRSTTLMDITSKIVPPRKDENIKHSHFARGMREITHIEWEPWEEMVADITHAIERQRLNRANRFYDVLERIQTLLEESRRRGQQLQATSEELAASNEEMEATNEEMQATMEELQATNEEMQATMEELEAANAYRQSMMDSMLDTFVATDSDGVITDVNPVACQVTGRSREELIGTPFKDYFTDPQRAEEGIRQVLAEDRVTNYELTMRSKDGRETVVSFNATTFKGADGRLLGVFAIARDITRRKRLEEQLEQEVRERSAALHQLEQAHRELEAFSYSVSHDLRAPLRSMDGFSQILLEDYADKLDEQGKDYLQRVREASQRMGGLVDAMLNLARVTRSEMRPETVDLSALAQTIAAELQKTQPERQVEFVIAPGLIANGDERLLRTVLENLLSNAWKFTGNHPRARIEFGVTEHESKPAYFVRDDGVGFDMAYADKLFSAFQRLHGPTEFPGIGIGLATVQRVIRRHGGHVWAEGAVEQGATFYFTI